MVYREEWEVWHMWSEWGGFKKREKRERKKRHLDVYFESTRRFVGQRHLVEGLGECIHGEASRLDRLRGERGGEGGGE